MLTTYNEGGLHWVDLDRPSQAEVAGLAQTYKLSPIVAEELAGPGSQPRVDIFGHYIYLRLNFPIFTKRGSGKEDRSQELNIILGKDFLITAHYENVRQLFDMARIIETASLLGRHPYSDAGQLFFALMDKLYRAIGKELKGLDARLQAIEERIFAGNERDMVADLSRASRDTIDLRRDLRAHAPVLAAFANGFHKIFDHEFSFELESLRSKNEELLSMLEGNRELLNDLRRTNDSLLSTKTNEAIKVLSVMGFIMFPLTLIAGIFGMNTTYLPFIGMEHDFAYVVAIMVAVFIGLWCYLAKKGWLR